MTFNTSLYTATASDTEMVMEFYHIPASITANLNRANRNTLVAVDTVLFFNANYFYESVHSIPCITLRKPFFKHRKKLWSSFNTPLQRGGGLEPTACFLIGTRPLKEAGIYFT